jgi:hypothetical protein
VPGGPFRRASTSGVGAADAAHPPSSYAHRMRTKHLTRTRLIMLVAVAAAYAVGTVIARRRGYNMGGNVTVRCRRGHLFTTIWVPGVSVKAVRLGWWRFQRCPVGHHWTLVTPVAPATLDADARRDADAHRDIRLP